MYIHHTLSFMDKKEQYLVNNKHVEQERSYKTCHDTCTKLVCRNVY